MSSFVKREKKEKKRRNHQIQSTTSRTWQAGELQQSAGLGREIS
jgi:hypothetical protein